MIRAYAITTNDNKAGERDCDIVFRPGAKRVADAYGGGYATFSNGLPYPDNKNDLLRKIGAMGAGLDLFAYFGHGYDDQLGNHIRSPGDIKELADALKPKMAAGGSIIFYSCLAGKVLTTRLLNYIGMDVWIYGHTTTAHSFKNPEVSEVHNGDGLRMRMLPAIYGPKLYAAWTESLTYTDLWLRFPLMYHVDIMKELNAIRLVGTWAVPGGKKYVFDWPVTNGRYSTTASICVNPNGTVRDSSGQTGSWEMDEELVISWDGGGTESWAMPLNPDGQTVRGASGLAKRTLRGKYGSIQG